MFFVFLAMLCSTSIALIFKYSENNKLNKYAVTTFNYVTAFIVSFTMILKSKLLGDLIIKFDKNLFGVMFENIMTNRLLSNEMSVIWSILIGGIAGIFFFLSFLYYQKAVKENGVGLAGAFSKLGILVPMTFSILLWRELPRGLQWFGIIISLLSIILVNISFDKNVLKNAKPTLLLLFLCGGFAEFSNKIFQKYAVLKYNSIFLFFVFFIAFLISLIFTLRQKLRITKKDIITGIAVGIPNLLSSYFLILGLNSLPASIVFPVYSAGTILLISISGFIMFKEHFTKKDLVSMAMIIIGLILINIG